ncbi:DUF6173 family protein [Siccibacter colletis]|uniref:DUF6173 family protein n=1 Tax=Siccibacter colletis TaxID=1505757 RepID=UPI001F2B89D1|nr:DUF6173 family protein [Siccibacter colletis]
MNNFNPLTHLDSAAHLEVMAKMHKDAGDRQFAVTGNFANEFHRRLIVWINDFHRTLDEDHEVGGQLASFGRVVEFHFTGISYWDPSLISFIGKLEDGSPVELVQHVSQINILLLKKKRLNPEEPKRPIGFAAWPEYEQFAKED